MIIKKRKGTVGVHCHPRIGICQPLSLTIHTISSVVEFIYKVHVAKSKPGLCIFPRGGHNDDCHATRLYVMLVDIRGGFPDIFQESLQQLRVKYGHIIVKSRGWYPYGVPVRGLLMQAACPGIRWAGGGWWDVITGSSVGIETIMIPVHEGGLLMRPTSCVSIKFLKLWLVVRRGQVWAIGFTNPWIYAIVTKAWVTELTTDEHIMWLSRVQLETNMMTSSNVNICRVTSPLRG